MLAPLRRRFLLAVCLVLAACLSPLEGGDGGEPLQPDLPGEDAGAPDASVTDLDAGLQLDAGVQLDAGEVDAGSLEDAGAGLDGGATAVDAGLPPDAGALTCHSCHGSALSPAPPSDTHGLSDPSLPAVGAHEAHLRGAAWHRPVDCTDCHLVPATTDAPGHLDPAPAEVTFSALAQHGVTAGYAGGTCGTYCHGLTLQGGSLTDPVWTEGASQTYCGSCHGLPPPAPHVQSGACQTCHPNAGPNYTFLDASRHLDGVLDVDTANVACGTCHGLPPATGAHLAHSSQAALSLGATYGDTRALEDYLPDGGASYQFGCGQCHPLDPARHLDGVLQVQLHDSAAPASSLKALNPASATWSPATGTCGTVYCHSSGQQAPAWVSTPAWTSRVHLGCDGCHANPPRYPSGDAGTATANTHLVLATNGVEYGHFGGLMSTDYYGNNHGGFSWQAQGAGAITCQTCHFDTVDPSNTGPSGFYYLDTTGDYTLPGGSTGYTCANAQCHGPSSSVAPVRAGKVLPLRHVNGRRDVVFDQRTTLPAGYDGGVPIKPTKPYWMFSMGFGTGRLGQMDLVGAGWQPATKTCTNVSCHQGPLANPVRTSAQWGGIPGGDPTSCNFCH